MKYRPDIDGLRALAVLPVLLFHLDVPGFPGGYVGVDVFFVISGYLITSIILPDVRAGTFSLIGFYERRCRRLFPALFTMLAVTGVVGVVLLMPYELQKFAESIAASALFFSNIVFANQAGYFDEIGLTKPLLHTWSLAVEEQFYIVYPLILLAICRYAPRRIAPIIAAIAVVSLALSVEAVAARRDGAYYLLHVRAFELMIGALLVVAPLPALAAGAARNLASVAGLGMIAAAVFLFSETTPFPGFAALLPCVGAALLLHAGKHGAGPLQRLIGLRPLVVVGKISYPIYLWHWPLIVFTVYVTMRPLNVSEQLTIAAATLLLSALTYRFIELPVQRRRVLSSTRELFRVTVPASAALIALACTVALLDGLPQRLPPAALDAAAFRLSRAEIREHCLARPTPGGKREPCFVGDQSRPSVDFAIVGDSHSQAMAVAIGERAEKLGLKGVVLVQGGCPGLPGVDKIGAGSAPCRPHMDQAFEELARQHVGTVLLISRWGFYARSDDPVAKTPGGLSATGGDALRIGFERARAALPDARIFVMRTVPQFDFPPPSMVARSIYYGQGIPAGVTQAEYDAQDARSREALGAARGITVLDPAPILCPGGQCGLTVGDQLIYFDDDHVSQFGARLIAPLFDDALRSARERDDAVAATGSAAAKPGPAGP